MLCARVTLRPAKPPCAKEDDECPRTCGGASTFGVDCVLKAGTHLSTLDPHVYLCMTPGRSLGRGSNASARFGIPKRIDKL